ncbi:hypothetical protein CPB83DRAFT_900747 [Crepidotus variabilis]|uniref:Uncharacterized protein n=1 Tax=Crepidotus variabilis TaxID=179855 RepID=A0A9P6E2U7_9AGAR|nr:hypothetical protein CPB83DRAFT_900747 [Crepidotus variabilis]
MPLTQVPKSLSEVSPNQAPELQFPFSLSRETNLDVTIVPHSPPLQTTTTLPRLSHLSPARESIFDCSTAIDPASSPISASFFAPSARSLSPQHTHNRYDQDFQMISRDVCIAVDARTSRLYPGHNTPATTQPTQASQSHLDPPPHPLTLDVLQDVHQQILTHGGPHTKYGPAAQQLLAIKKDKCSQVGHTLKILNSIETQLRGLSNDAGIWLEQ